MANSTILQLPSIALGLSGTEQLECVVVGPTGSPLYSARLSSSQLAALGGPQGPTGPTGPGVGATGPTGATGPPGSAGTNPGVATDSPSGTENDYSVGGTMGPTIGFIDLSPIGTCNITGLAAGYDTQLVIITNLTANSLTLNALNSGSTSANQFRMGFDLTLTQFNSQSFEYSLTIGKWIPA